MTQHSINSITGFHVRRNHVGSTRTSGVRARGILCHFLSATQSKVLLDVDETPSRSSRQPVIGLMPPSYTNKQVRRGKGIVRYPLASAFIVSYLSSVLGSTHITACVVAPAATLRGAANSDPETRDNKISHRVRLLIWPHVL